MESADMWGEDKVAVTPVRLGFLVLKGHRSQ
jgi:hypothetical protein